MFDILPPQNIESTALRLHNVYWLEVVGLSTRVRRILRAISCEPSVSVSQAGTYADPTFPYFKVASAIRCRRRCGKTPIHVRIGLYIQTSMQLHACIHT